MRLEEHSVRVGTQQPNVRYRTQLNAKELKIANSIFTVPFSVLKCKVFCSEQVLKITSGSIGHVYVQSCLLIIFQHRPRLSCSTFDWVLMNSQSELTEVLYNQSIIIAISNTQEDNSNVNMPYCFEPIGFIPLKQNWNCWGISPMCKWVNTENLTQTRSWFQLFVTHTWHRIFLFVSPLERSFTKRNGYIPQYKTINKVNILEKLISKSYIAISVCTVPPFQCFAKTFFQQHMVELENKKITS